MVYSWTYFWPVSENSLLIQEEFLVISITTHSYVRRSITDSQYLTQTEMKKNSLYNEVVSYDLYLKKQKQYILTLKMLS